MRIDRWETSMKDTTCASRCSFRDSNRLMSYTHTCVYSEDLLFFFYFYFTISFDVPRQKTVFCHSAVNTSSLFSRFNVLIMFCPSLSLSLSVVFARIVFTLLVICFSFYRIGMFVLIYLLSVNASLSFRSPCFSSVHLEPHPPLAGELSTQRSCASPPSINQHRKKQNRCRRSRSKGRVHVYPRRASFFSL